MNVLAAIIVSGLVVSTGPVPAAAQADYADWGANHVHVWQADESAYWDMPTTVWVDADGCGLHWDREPRCDHDLPDTVVRRQVGDEPGVEPFPIGDPQEEYTNFSYWAPLAHDALPHEAMPRIMDAYGGTHFTTSEYLIRDDAHWRVIDFFAEHARDHGQTWGVYLNGYSGYETDFTMDHTAAELREHAYGALAYGAREFVWFTYAFGPDGHEEARQGGGSIITEDGTWARGPHWATTREINHGLLFLSSRIGTAQDTLLTDSFIEGTFATGQLLVGRTDGVEVAVSGWLIRPSGTAFYADGTITLDQGETYLIADTSLGAMEMR